MISEWTVIMRLLLAGALGGIIGLQRESVNRPAGFRTHTLVATGAALIMLVSVYGFEQHLHLGRVSDPARLAAQVISGIGFLGAGTILKDGNTVRGLTTAASLWVVSGVGLAIGAGFLVGGIAATVLVYIVLSSLGHLDKYLFHRSHYQTINLWALDRPGQLGRIASFVGQHNVSILNVRLRRDDSDDHRVRVIMQLKLPLDYALDDLLMALSGLDGVVDISQSDV